MSLMLIEYFKTVQHEKLRHIKIFENLIYGVYIRVYAKQVRFD